MSTAIADKDKVEKIKREERAANERKIIATGEAMRAPALKRRSAKNHREYIVDSDGDPSRPSSDASSEDDPVKRLPLTKSVEALADQMLLFHMTRVNKEQKVIYSASLLQNENGTARILQNA
jgi:hypothetical protein